VVAQPPADPVCCSTRHPGVGAGVKGGGLSALRRLRQVAEPVPNSRTLGAWLDLVLLSLVLSPLLSVPSCGSWRKSCRECASGSDDKQVGGSDLFPVRFGHA
jgi:hypothetical protein